MTQAVRPTAPTPLARASATRMSAGEQRPVILLVEDNAADEDLTREALVGGLFDSELHVVRNAEAALDFLRRRGAHAAAPVPDLILLDQHLPGLDGTAVLEALKGDAALCEIPVVVFSSSSDADDVHRAYRLRANCYVTKPVGLEQFLTTVRAIEHFWLGVAMLPGASP